MPCFVVTCSHHPLKHRSLKDASPEVGASCSSRILPTVSTGYPRVPHGSFSLCHFHLHQTDSFFPYIFCCIPIPVMLCIAFWTDPFSHRHIFQSFLRANSEADCEYPLDHALNSVFILPEAPKKILQICQPDCKNAEKKSKEPFFDSLLSAIFACLDFSVVLCLILFFSALVFTSDSDTVPVSWRTPS